MNKLCLVFLGALLFALHLTSQVQAQSTTMSPKNATWPLQNTSAVWSTTMRPLNVTTGNSTKDKSASGRTEVPVLLLPLSLWFLLGWS